MIWKSIDTIPLNKEILVVGDAYTEGGSLWYENKVMLVILRKRYYGIKRKKNSVIFNRKIICKHIIECKVAHTYYYELDIKNLKCWTEVPEIDVEIS